MKLIFLKFLALIALLLAPKPAIQPVTDPTPTLIIQETPVPNLLDRMYSTPTPSLTATPTPDIQQFIDDFRNAVASYTPEPRPSPIVIYIQPSALPVAPLAGATVTPTPAPVVEATPAPTVEPTPTPRQEVKCETTSGSSTGVVKCYSTLSEAVTYLKVRFWQISDRHNARGVMIRALDGSVIFAKVLDAGEEEEVSFPINVPPENSTVKYYNAFSYEIDGAGANLHIFKVLW